MLDLIGKVVDRIEGLEQYSGNVRIYTEDGSVYLFYHEQDCCETVALEDFEMSANSLQGGIVISLEEVTENAENVAEYGTWTFYKLETTKGGLFMRWLGESNGYYGEGVNFKKIKQ